MSLSCTYRANKITLSLTFHRFFIANSKFSVVSMWNLNFLGKKRTKIASKELKFRSQKKISFENQLSSAMKSNTKLQIPALTARVVGVRMATVLSAALLAACGGGGPDSVAASDNAISLATITTGYTPKVTPPTVFTPAPAPAPAPVITTAGTVITDVRIQNTGNAGTNVPFTFGQVFAAGQLSSTEGLAAKLADGTIVPLQTNVTPSFRASCRPWPPARP
jgi:hypothetical protein